MDIGQSVGKTTARHGNSKRIAQSQPRRLEK
jgi:hypothetical protein